MNHIRTNLEYALDRPAQHLLESPRHFVLPLPGIRIDFGWCPNLKSIIFGLASDSGADGGLSGLDWWYFQHSHKPRFFAFGIAPRVAPFCFRMSGESKDFDYPIPGNLLPKLSITGTDLTCSALQRCIV